MGCLHKSRVTNEGRTGVKKIKLKKNYLKILLSLKRNSQRKTHYCEKANTSGSLLWWLEEWIGNVCMQNEIVGEYQLNMGI